MGDSTHTNIGRGIVANLVTDVPCADNRFRPSEEEACDGTSSSVRLP